MMFILLIFNEQSWMESLSPSPARIYNLKMASLSPFPQLHFDECKFTGTLVSNPLLPLSHERQTRQSNSSGSRRLNRGSCCTPKFALSFIKIFLTRLLGLKTRLGFAQLKTSSCTDDLKLGFEFAQGFLDYQCFI